MASYSAEDRKILEKHVSSVESPVYCIYNLPPEVVAVLFAFVSRSPASFRDNLLRLIKGKQLDMGRLIECYVSVSIDYADAKRKAKEFHEKWVVGYGHSSVAEHAVASIAMEDVSIIASKVIEDNRLASFTEKSTRYQVFGRDRYYKPKSIMMSKHAKLYQETCDSLFDTYARITPDMVRHMGRAHPQEEGQPDTLFAGITKARACDVVRYLLPAATQTNLAMTANAREIEHAITKMISHPLEEMRDIGRRLKEEVQKIIPTLVKYADENAYLKETGPAMEAEAASALLRMPEEAGKSVALVRYDNDAEDRLVCALLYRFSDRPYEQVRKAVGRMSEAEKGKAIDGSMRRMGTHDWPIRELEHTSYTFDILMDYGAYRDLQRHRICTQSTQDTTCDHGYEMPEQIRDAGFEKEYVEAMEKAKRAYDTIRKDFPKEAQYLVPLAFRKRTLFTLNLRSLMHMIRLRTGKEGHASYRIICARMHEEVRRVQPLLARYIQMNYAKGPSRG
ncbi:FAD-dependent thymidylate synthase [Candidatus Woesearchaeota archaeon]|nr:FAD-dependent thymidylate synthase [Candidatus Woesearchaeota archaeon]